jgi:hypothetical protein
VFDDLVVMGEVIDVGNRVSDHHHERIHSVAKGTTHFGFYGKDVSIPGGNHNGWIDMGRIVGYSRRKGKRRNPDSPKHIVSHQHVGPPREVAVALVG